MRISRITWLLLAVLVPAIGAAAQSLADQPYTRGLNDAITDVPGVKVGHYTDPRTPRGTTVLIPGDTGGICAADAAGGDPLVINASTFSPTTLAEECDALVLTGGSAFGLSTAAGVVEYLYEHGRGVETRAGRVPIVPAAVIFDLPVGNATIHPTAEWGYKAAAAAKAGPVEQGNVGAGAGGTVGKSPGGVRLKGGLGTASVVLPGDVVVGAIVVLNALGDVINPATGEFYAVAGGYDRAFFRQHYIPPSVKVAHAAENTTLAIIATNAKLTKTQMTKVAQLAHDGLARAIRPVHSMLDGDTIFVVGVGNDKRIELKTSFPGEEVDIVGGAAGDVLIQAIIKGMQSATSIANWASYRDWKKNREAK